MILILGYADGVTSYPTILFWIERITKDMEATIFKLQKQ